MSKVKRPTTAQVRNKMQRENEAQTAYHSRMSFEIGKRSTEKYTPLYKDLPERTQAALNTMAQKYLKLDKEIKEARPLFNEDEWLELVGIEWLDIWGRIDHY